MDNSNLEKLREKFKEEVLAITIPFFELQNCADLLDKQKTESYIKAVDAYRVALSGREDPVLKAIAFAAFSQCYSDMGLYDKVNEMKNKRRKLTLKYTE